MSDELLRAMADAYFSASGPSDVAFGLEMAAMRAVLDVLHSNGYRRCAEGQKVTQYCSAWEQADKACRDLAEKVIPNIRARAEKAEAEVERLGMAYENNTAKAMEYRDRAEKAEAEVERLQARDDEWQRKASAWMASPEAVQRLDGYRELAQKLNAAEAEVEQLRDGRAALLEEIEMLRERIGNIIDPNDYGKGIWTRND